MEALKSLQTYIHQHLKTPLLVLPCVTEAFQPKVVLQTMEGKVWILFRMRKINY